MLVMRFETMLSRAALLAQMRRRQSECWSSAQHPPSRSMLSMLSTRKYERTVPPRQKRCFWRQQSLGRSRRSFRTGG